jgi:hypothetical protein
VGGGPGGGSHGELLSRLASCLACANMTGTVPAFSLAAFRMATLLVGID